MPAAGLPSPEQVVAEAENRIRNAGRIPMISLEVSEDQSRASYQILIVSQLSLGILFGLAVVACLGRMIIRLSSRGRLALDDGLLIFAVICLAFSTGIMIKVAPNYYIVQALIRGDPAAKMIVSAHGGYQKLTAHYNWTFANIVLSWTAIFFVKGSYFALFYPMMSVMSKHVLRFYWAAVAFSAASWFVLAFGSNFILCKELGTAAGKFKYILKWIYLIVSSKMLLQQQQAWHAHAPCRDRYTRWSDKPYHCHNSRIHSPQIHDARNRQARRRHISDALDLHVDLFDHSRRWSLLPRNYRLPVAVILVPCRGLHRGHHGLVDGISLDLSWIQ
jgi:hypothetical protein